MSEQDMTKEQLDKALFSHLIMMLATSALQQMGRIPNPMTQKTEMNLEAASATIDMLDMLQAKTQGNLDDEESQMLNEALTSLKMNFVEVQKATGAAPAAPPQAADEPLITPASAEPATPSDEPAASDEDKKPKFQKKYD